MRDMMPKKVLHIVFGCSPAGILRRALYDLDVDEKVLDIMDNLSIGPIASGASEARRRWMVQQLGSDWKGIGAGDADLPAKCRASRPPLIAWFAPNRAESYAGFQWWLSEIGMTPCSIMSIPDLHFCNTEAMIELVGREAKLNDADRHRYHAEWSDLKKNDANLRIVQQGNLVSVDDDYFDRYIYAYIASEWQVSSRVVMRSTAELSMETGHFVDECYAFWRLRRFADNGRVEFSGDKSDMRNCRVRLKEN